MPFSKIKNQDVKPNPKREIPYQEIIILTGLELDASINEEMRDGPNKKDEVKISAYKNLRNYKLYL